MSKTFEFDEAVIDTLSKRELEVLLTKVEKRISKVKVSKRKILLNELSSQLKVYDLTLYEVAKWFKR